MGATLMGNKKSGFKIDGMNSTLIGTIQREKCPYCPFKFDNSPERNKPCMGMDSMDGKGSMISDVTDEKLIEVVIGALCRGWMKKEEKEKMISDLGLNSK